MFLLLFFLVGDVCLRCLGIEMRVLASDSFLSLRDRIVNFFGPSFMRFRRIRGAWCICAVSFYGSDFIFFVIQVVINPVSLNSTKSAAFEGPPVEF